MHTPEPKKWKLMLITWLFIYPSVNILFVLLFPLMEGFNQWIKTLVLTMILVPLMGIILPKLHQRFWGWIIK
jgi:antibiotic biosynthesis monooxygenase (ABM) superfamily enzyme|tara:strand:+ start:182 stop:397 length:216 start_codon:yes stop_codon:yes gene_type:complete